MKKFILTIKTVKSDPSIVYWSFSLINGTSKMSEEVFKYQN